MSNPHGHDGGFECPGCLPPGTVNLLAQGEHTCPPQVPTARFTSPNSQLPPQELAELQACIHEINEFLLAVGTPRPLRNREQLRHRVRRLIGITVRVAVSCEGNPAAVEVSGGLKDVGRDFIQVDTVGPQTFMPFDRICTITRTDTGPLPPRQGGALRHIDPVLRRNLILRFGETVACDPELINIFFGLPLHLRLTRFLGQQAFVQTDGQSFEGPLCAAEEEFIHVQVAENRVRQINLADICFIRV